MIPFPWSRESFSNSRSSTSNGLGDLSRVARGLDPTGRYRKSKSEHCMGGPPVRGSIMGYMKGRTSPKSSSSRVKNS